MKHILSTPYPFQLIGGNNLSSKKPFISFDCKLVFIPSQNSIRIYLIESGLLYQTLIPSTHYHDKEEITNVEQNPLNPDSSIISYSSKGTIIFWDYINGSELEIYNIFYLLYDVNMDFANIILTHGVDHKNHHSDSSSPNLTFYFGFNIKHSRPFIDFAKLEILQYRTKCHSSLVNLDSRKSNLSFDPYTNGIAFGASNQYVATITGKSLQVLSIPVSERINKRVHIIKEGYFNCIAAHPVEFILAVGDNNGRIFIYRENFLHSNKPLRTIMHWHFTAVNDMCFSPSASFLYSGGNEGVLVRWDISGSHENNYYPRLGSPIRHIVCDRINQKIVLSHSDNCVQFLNLAEVEGTVRLDGLTYMSKNEFDSTDPTPYWDVKSSCIVLRGKSGHLQFFSPTLQKQLYQLDVIKKNFIPEESDKKIVDLSISRFSVSSCGNWIAAIEYRDDGINLIEMRLKFFQYLENDNEKYCLNTLIHLPHNKAVNDMKFSNDSSILVTTSDDKDFKIWRIFTHDEENKTSWSLEKTGYLNRIQKPNLVAISCDSSMIAVTFDSTTTLWDTSTINSLSLREVLLPSDESEKPVKSIAFGTENPTLFVEVRDFEMRIWNLFTFSVVKSWRPRKDQTILLVGFDTTTDRMIVYLSNRSLLIMNFADGSLIYKLEISNGIQLGKINAILFVPHKNLQRNDRLFSRSALCLIDRNQYIFSVGLTDSNYSMCKGENVITEELTPFAQMLINAKEKALVGEKMEAVEMGTYFDPCMDSKKLIQEIFVNVPSYVLPPMESICGIFLTRLLNVNEAGQKENGDNIENNQNDIDKNDLTIISCVQEMQIDKNFLLPKDNVIFDENYDWLENVEM